MTSVLEKLLPGAYDGARFYIIESTTKGGRELFQKQIANAPRQVLEDGSLKPRIHTLKFVTKSEQDSEGKETVSYFKARDAMWSALERIDSHDLEHPLYGTIRHCKAMRPVVCNEKQISLGRCDWEVTFEIEDPSNKARPVEVVDSDTDVKQANENLQEETGKDLEDNEVPPVLGAFDKAKEAVGGMVDSAKGAMAKVAKARDQIDAVTQKLNEFEENISKLINDPLQMAGEFAVLFETLDSAFELAQTAPGVLRSLISRSERAINGAIENPFEEAQKVFASFARLGDSITTFGIQTDTTIRAKAYVDDFNRTVRASAIGYQYQNAVQRELGTVQEIDDVIEGIEVEFQAVVDTLVPSTRLALQEVRQTALAVFARRKLSADRVKLIDTPATSAQLLSFQFYGTSQFGERIAALNPDMDPSHLDGSVSILTLGSASAGLVPR